MRDKKISLWPEKSLMGFFLQFLFLTRSILVWILGGDLCLRCGEVSGVYPLCPSCMKQFFDTALPVSEETASARCSVCGKALLSEISVCTACRNEVLLLHTDGVFPLHAYRLWKKDLLFAWKSEDKRTLSPVFACMMHRAYKELCSRFGKNLPLVPVPPRPGKIRERGWDQVDEVCYYMHLIWKVPVLKLLVRKSQVQQKKLGRLARRKASAASYVLAGEKKLRHYAPVPPEKVILVDDVLTTGSTLNVCAERLKSYGIQKVYALTLFSVA